MLLAAMAWTTLLLPQTPPLWNVLPSPLAAAVRAPLQAALGGLLECRDVAAADLAAAAAAASAPVLLFGVDELQLQALAQQQLLADLPAALWQQGALPPRARSRDGRYALLLRSPTTLAYDPRQLQPADVPRTWVELATSPLAQDQLALCGPEVDAAPWLGWMSLRLAGGGVEADGYALWTALDARARYFDSYAAALQALDAGTVRFCALPLALALRGRQLEGKAPLAVRDPDDGQPAQWLGVALLARGTPDAAATLALQRLLAPELRQQLAQALGMSPIETADAAAAVAPPADDDAPVQAWLLHFQQRLRGQGRSLENLDGWLDLVFALLFCGFLWFVWRRMRKGEGEASEPL